MKISYYNKTVRAEAESLADIKILLSLNGKVEEEVEAVRDVKEPKKYKKSAKVREPIKCPACGTEFRGQFGLSVHYRHHPSHKHTFGEPITVPSTQ